MLILLYRNLTCIFVMLAEAIPKEEFNTLKNNFAELEKKHDELLLGKAWLESEF